MTSIYDVFYKETDIPIDVIKLILHYLKCDLCDNTADDSCIYCAICFCRDCYSPFYGACVCYKCSHKLF